MASAAPTVPWAQHIKDAALAAAVALALAFPLVGFQTIDVPAGLRVETRFDWVAIGVVAVFFGRLLFSLLASWRAGRATDKTLGDGIDKLDLGRASLVAADNSAAPNQVANGVREEIRRKSRRLSMRGEKVSQVGRVASGRGAQEL